MAFAVAWYPPKPVTRATATGPGTRVSRRGRPAQTPRPCQATPTRVRFPLAAAGRAASQGDGSSAPGSCRGPQGVESHDRRVVLVGLTTSFAAGGSAQARGSVLKEEVVGGRTMITTASGVKYADIAIGSGSPIRYTSMPVAFVPTVQDPSEGIAPSNAQYKLLPHRCQWSRSRVSISAHQLCFPPPICL